MQYRKHNFVHNFLTAVAVDQQDAWEIICGEINDTVLDDRAKLRIISILKSANVVVPDGISDRNLALLIFDTLYNNPASRPAIVNLFIDLHSDANPFVGSKNGPHDMLIATAEKDPVAALNTLIAEKEPELTRDQLRKMVAQDMQDKQAMRNLPVPFVDRLKNAGTGKVLVIATVTTLIIIGAYRVVTNQSLIPNFK